MPEPRWLSSREARAWRGYMSMRALLDLQISRDLSRDSGLSDAEYTVLSVLSESPGHRLQMIELADRLLWSISRLSHQLSRMERRELVRREPEPTNQRASAAVLTAEGLLAIEKAAPAHVESVRRHFIDLLTDCEIEALGRATEKVVNHLREEQP